MSEDPILREIHDTRAKLLADAGGDMKKLIAQIRSREFEENSRVVSSKARSGTDTKPLPAK